MRRAVISLLAVVFSFNLTPAVQAFYISDIGFDALQTQLGASTPTGAGVRIAQVEAPINDVSGGAAPIFMPDPSNTEFIGKMITPVGGNPSGTYSGHATGIGSLFYGNASSIGTGIMQIDSYDANSWINSLYNPVTGRATTSPDRVANHSWVGGGTDGASDGTILRLVDRQVALNNYIQVVGLTNGPGNSPLLSSGYNVIAVGRTDGVNQQGAVPVTGDSLYGAGRTVPTLVAPQPLSSTATPVVSAAAALLVQTGHQGGLSLSTGYTTISGIGTIYDAERSETVKAALMAGADRQTANTSTTANITDYRSAGHETANGLDNRYGAGQVNIYNSYRILAGGEQKSFQMGGVDISAFGFDYSTIGGLNGTGRTASYFFNAASDLTLFASLAWNVGVSNDATLTASLHHLSLSLFDVTNNRLLASSASLLDNTQNLYLKLLLGGRYEMRVTANESDNFLSGYALAWRMDATPLPAPIPPAAWLFGTGVLALLGWTRLRSTACRAVRPG
jgi:hypothetical protein